MSQEAGDGRYGVDAGIYFHWVAGGSFIYAGDGGGGSEVSELTEKEWNHALELFIARFGKTKTKTPAAAGGGGGGVSPYGVKRTDFKMGRELDCGCGYDNPGDVCMVHEPIVALHVAAMKDRCAQVAAESGEEWIAMKIRALKDKP